ncbi:MAG: DotA/TraY family protein [Bdellovibrionales bacterium]
MNFGNFFNFGGPGQPGGDPSGKKTSWARFFFHPELGKSTQSIGLSFQMFVSLLATLFVTSGMLETNHRFFAPGARFTLADLFNETYARFDWRDKDKLPQNIFFIATWGLLIATALWIVVAILLFIAGPSAAHAAEGGGMFTPPESDKVGDVVDSLVLQIEGFTLDGYTLGGEASGIFQELLRTMLGFYSRAILVFASFMVLYHVLHLVVTAAWEGKPLGGADQVWAPLRLVLAIGLLVPLGTGLNTAQYAVLEVAKLGSGLASRVWIAAADTFLPPEDPAEGERAPFRPSTTLGDHIHDLTLIRLCQIDINQKTLSGTGDSNLLTGTDSEVVRGHFNLLRFSGETQIKYGPGLDKNLCGTVKWPSPGETVAETITGPDRTTAEVIRQARTDMVTLIDIHFKAIDDAVCGFAGVLFAGRYSDANATTPNFTPLTAMYNAYPRTNLRWPQTMPLGIPVGQVGLSMTDERSRNCHGKPVPDTDIQAVAAIYAAVAEYEAAITEQADATYRAILSNLRTEMESDNPLGWMAAGSRYMRIAMAQKQIHDLYDLSPTVKLGSVFRSKTETDKLKCEGLGSVVDGVPNNRCRFMRSLRGADDSQGYAHAGKPYSAMVTNALQIGYEALEERPSMISNIVSLTDDRRFEPFDDGENETATAGGISGVLASIRNFFSFDKDYFMNLVAPSMRDPLPNLFAFGHALYWIALSFIGLSMIFGTGGLAMVFMMGPLLFSGALMLAFILPLTPMIRFLLSTFSWLLAVLEAIVGMPLFALAHLSPKAEGIMGNAKAGYSMLFSIALRPVLLVIGLICSIIMLTIGMFLLNWMFRSALDAVWGDGKVFVITSIIFALIYAFNAFSMCQASFKIIDEIANKSMGWFGQQGYSFYNAHSDINEAAVVDMAQGGMKAIGTTADAVHKSVVAPATKGLLKGGGGGGRGGSGDAVEDGDTPKISGRGSGGGDKGGGGGGKGGGGSGGGGPIGRMLGRAGATASSGLGHLGGKIASPVSRRMTAQGRIGEARAEARAEASEHWGRRSAAVKERARLTKELYAEPNAGRQAEIKGKIGEQQHIIEESESKFQEARKGATFTGGVQDRVEAVIKPSNSPPPAAPAAPAAAEPAPSGSGGANAPLGRGGGQDNGGGSNGGGVGGRGS